MNKFANIVARVLESAQPWSKTNLGASGRWKATTVTMIRGFHLVRHLSMAASSSNSQPAGLVETSIREKVTTLSAFLNP